MDTNGGRGDDFALNQDQECWAEQRLHSCPDDVQFVYFGLSDLVDPSDPTYAEIGRKHRLMLVVECKRADLFAFQRRDNCEHPTLLKWSERPLNPNDIT